ncbi:hypothetical protein [Thermococcus waiotapuensis]|uniref:DUF8203 domain-containing protein n=1 Tax=Thermococcus waiotapuensis TaxID=90909 RepID=A0AAE4NWU4_9EURY|nr:hypothetical protein [Thermococcus waiotapuensis]MDV3104674.1 hypothetical protein [Thermococcus waiotapuensis]
MGLMIGSDEGDITFVGKKGTFIARIGVAVSVSNKYFDTYLQAYRKFFEGLKDDRGIKTPRWIFSSSDLRGYLIGREGDPTKYLLFMKNFVDEVVVPNKVTTNFVFASFGVKEVSMPNGVQKSVMAFLKNVLKSYFAYIPAWVVVSRLNNPKAKAKVYIDNFNPSPKTKAWDELLKHVAELKIIPNGDKVNPLVSTADLLLRYIKESILLSKWRLDVDTLIRNLPSLGFPVELLKVYHVGKKALSKIVPTSTENDILPQNWYPRPLIYVIKEDLFQKDEEQRLIEQSPVFEYLLRHASKVGGSIKFLALQGGSGGDIDDLRKNGGIVVSLGPHGSGMGEYLVRLGFPVTHLQISELVSKYGG